MKTDGIEYFNSVWRNVRADDYRCTDRRLSGRCDHHHHGLHHQYRSDYYRHGLLQRPRLLPADGHSVLYSGRQPDEIRRYLAKNS